MTGSERVEAQTERKSQQVYSGLDQAERLYVGFLDFLLRNSLTIVQYITNDKKDAAWVKMRSVTEQAALDEFLSTAELAGTDFTAEKLNSVKIIHSDQKNPYLLSAQEERSAIKKQRANREKLTVPRRPPWDENTTPQELDEREKASLLEWRRGLADVQENQDLLMTPFERNLEVWRQLWRVIERSDLVVQIVDARNPLLFRSEDLEKYVKEVDPRKNNLLLVNKADLMTLEQRQAWAGYFEEAGINYKFFSAHLAKEYNELRDLETSSEDEEQHPEREGGEKEDEVNIVEDADSQGEGEIRDTPVEDVLAKEAERIDLQEKEEEKEKWASEEDLEDTDQRTKILTVDELEALFLENAPEIENPDPENPRKTQIGLVGYPNVGKSSTINALVGAKKVSVSATPGKTKHFQTIHLSPSVLLCDCPGLVFPNFATTKAELVINGILPIDQLREFIGPAGLVAQRIPQPFFEAIYGVKVRTRPLEEGGTGIPTANEILSAYARGRGFATTGQGQPDEARAARYILKDYVSGKLLFCHPPPADPVADAADFNRELYDFAHLPQKRRAYLAARDEASLSGTAVDDVSLMDNPASISGQPIQGPKSRGIDANFFGPGHGNAGHVRQPFNYKYSEQGQLETERGKLLSGRKLKAMFALEKGVDASEVRLGGKKHFKGGKRGKVKSASAKEEGDF